ncbi:MAG: hypothetical protein ACI9SG_001676 [Maribacter sp.]|jgi:hypothetical protein
MVLGLKHGYGLKEAQQPKDGLELCFPALSLKQSQDCSLTIHMDIFGRRC